MSRRRGRVETMEYLGAARRFIRGAGVRVAEEGDEHELRELLALLPVLTAAINTAVDGQIARGKSWADIATATGKTRQAAQLRWGKKGSQ